MSEEEDKEGEEKKPETEDSQTEIDPLMDEILLGVLNILKNEV